MFSFGDEYSSLNIFVITGHCENELKDGGLLIYCKGTKRSFEYALKQLRLLDFDISLHKSNAMSKSGC